MSKVKTDHISADSRLRIVYLYAGKTGAKDGETY